MVSVGPASTAERLGTLRARPGKPRRIVALLALSRVGVWGVGIIAALVVSHPQRFGLGSLGDVLAAPVLNDDARWFTGVAVHGYGVFPHATAYLPLYPVLLSIAGPAGLGTVAILGTVISTAAFAAALVVLHRLVALDFGDRVATRTVVLTALFPTAVFFTAAYAESLFLLLIVGAFYAARTERWAIASVLGALAGATRITGIVLVVALLCLYLFGPRGGERFSQAQGGGLRGFADRFRPRFRLQRDALWIALVPAGYVAFAIYTLFAFGDALANVHQAPFWGVTYHGPLFGLVDGTRWAITAVGHLLSSEPGTSRSVLLGHIASWAFLPFALIAIVGAFRREPIAYGVYALLGFAPAVTDYSSAHPLMSLQRYMLLLFPLQLWLALWAGTRARYVLCAAVSAAGLIACSALYATGRLA